MVFSICVQAGKGTVDLGMQLRNIGTVLCYSHTHS